jgi:tetratricopeptide (TPR) repeat protein
LLVVGGSPADRARRARANRPESVAAVTLDARTLPFTRVEAFALPSSPRVLLIHDIERAFPNAQTNGVRLVLTQSTYLLQKWIDRLDADDGIVATADRAALEVNAPEALQARGPWRLFELVDLDDSQRHRDTKDTKHTKDATDTTDTKDTKDTATKEDVFAVSPVSSVSSTPTNQLLASAYMLGNAAERVRPCREAVAIEPESAIAHLALASACREAGDATAARAALDRALTLAPGFEAAHYESGKLWLARDDLPRARDAFQRAAGLMPGFATAYTNLGAALGELDDPAAALAAFEHALAFDPDSHPLLNNIGVVSREIGQLARSEAALRRVVELAPGFVFGHYNLGHTLFLAGRYGDALRAYEEGHRLDPQKNRRQACRMAMARLACGDRAGAARDLWNAANGAPLEEREDLLLEAYEIAHAWQQRHPERADDGSRAFLDRLGSEIIKSE